MTEAGAIFDLLFKFWGSAGELKKSLLGSDNYKLLVQEVLELSAQQLDALEADQIYEKLANL